MILCKCKQRISLVNEISVWFGTVVCCLTVVPFCMAQPQHNFWYFGRHAGLDFSSGSPVAVYGKTYTHEGTASVSDVSGNLLFYIGSDTVTPPPPPVYDSWHIYDASHSYMQNGTGILGNTSTSQGPAIIPKPGACNKYMIFHVEGLTGGCNQNCGFFYSEVDMTLNGGLGAVTVKNISIYNPPPSPAVCEQIAITPHANGTDYWVVVHEVGNQNFRVYPVTSAGLGAVSVQTLPPVHPSSSLQITGYAKFNAAGTKLAWGGANALYLYDFNNATGTISNPQNLNLGGNAYGIEFSPNGQFLYVTDNNIGANIFQYDLTAVPISSSKVQIDPGSVYNKGAIQLAPDGKIYVGISGQNFLGVINSPNVAYPGCNYVDNGLLLHPGTTNSNAGGLPYFPASYNPLSGGFSVSSSANNILCNGGTGSASVMIAGGNPPYTYSWNPTGQTTSTATGLSQGIYTVTITDASGCSATDTVLITEPTALTTTITSTNSCGSSGSASVNVTGGVPAYTYLWSNGASVNLATGLSPGNYSVLITDANGCTNTASVTISSGNPLSATISASSSSVCSGNTATLTAGGGGSYSWNTGQTSSSISVSPTGTSSYTVVVDSSGCTDTAAITIHVMATPTAVISPNTSICSGSSVTLTAGGGGNYLWNTGATTSSIVAAPTSTGTYSVIVSAGSCSDTAVGTVVVNSNPVASISSNATITSGQTVTLTAGGGVTYSWNSGETESVLIISPTITTYYCVTVTDTNLCTDTACATIIVEPIDCSGNVFIPNAFSPNDDGMNDYFKIHYPNANCIKELYITIYDRWGEKIFESNEITFQWNGIYKSKKLNTAVFVYVLEINYKDGKQTIQKGNLSLIR